MDFKQNSTINSIKLRSEINWQFLSLLSIPVLSIYGNLLVGLAVYLERRLRNRFNYFLVSLATSDFLCASFVMPFSGLKMINEELTQTLPKELCLAWYSLDVFFTASTIIHLCTISLDRYMALNNPIRFHKSRKKYSLAIKISISWLIPFGISCPLFLASLKIENSESYKGCGPNNAIFIMTAVIITFVLPLIIMTISYILTVITIRRQTRNLDHLSSMYSRKKSVQSNNGNESTVMSQQSMLIPHSKTSQSTMNLTTSVSNLPRKVSDDVIRPLTNDQRKLLCASVDITRRSLVSCNNDELVIPAKQPISKRYDSTVGPLSRLSRQFSIGFNRRFTNSNISNNGNGKLSFMHRNSSITSERLRYCAGSLMNSRLSVNSKRAATSEMGLRYIQKSRKAVQVLGIVFLLFVCCYLPFFVIYVCDFFCQSCRTTTSMLLPYAEWVGYSASMMNPIVYHIFNPTFRKTFNNILRCNCFKSKSNHKSGSLQS